MEAGVHSTAKLAGQVAQPHSAMKAPGALLAAVRGRPRMSCVTELVQLAGGRIDGPGLYLHQFGMAQS